MSYLLNRLEWKFVEGLFRWCGEAHSPCDGCIQQKICTRVYDQIGKVSAGEPFVMSRIENRARRKVSALPQVSVHGSARQALKLFEWASRG